jgi:hypothetical protein
MFAQQLFAQWKWSRDLLAFFIVLGFAIPLLILWIALPMIGQPAPTELVEVGRVIGGGCVILAVLSGASIAAQGYSLDERGGHVYALALPVSRARFLVGRSLTALALLALPGLALWLGGLLAAGQVQVPPTIQAYAGSLAMRTILAAWLAHSCMFALRYGAGRRAKGVFLVLLVGGVALTILSHIVLPGGGRVFVMAKDFLVSHPGPFGVFFGRWTLFDV